MCKSIIKIFFFVASVYSCTLFAMPVPAIPNPEDPNLTSFAMIIPVEEATLASQFTGEITSISARPGEKFNQGAILVEFDCDVKKVELASAKAEVEATKIAWQSAEALDKLKSVSKVEVAKARIDYQRATIEVERLETVMKQCRIEAPFAGRVIEWFAHPHEDVTPGQPLIKILNDKNLEIKIYIPSLWLAWIDIGTPFTMQVNELGKAFTATVTKINPQVDTASQTIDIYGEFTQPSDKLISGMSGKATFKRPKP